MPVNLGTAQGEINISTRGVTGAEKTVKTASANMTRELGGIGKGVGGLQSKFRELDSFLGASFLIGAGVGFAKMNLELGRAAAQAELTKKSFDNLAAGVGQDSDKMLEGMRKASHGVVTDSALILGANRAITGGVAKNSEEMNQLLNIARATGAAFGLTTAEAFQRITEGVAKLEPELLDELGITVRLDTVFRQYAASLGTTADRLTDAQRKQAFLNEIIEQTKPAVDAAAGAGENAADKYERMTVATDNLGKSWGDFLNKSGFPVFIDLVSARINSEIGLIEGWIRLVKEAQNAAAGLLGMGGGAPAVSAGTPAWMTGVSKAASAPLGPDLSAEKTKIHLDWAQGIEDLNRQVHADILDEETSFGASRAKTVADYSKGIAREERDFATTRLRAEMDMLDSIAGLAKDAARREDKQGEELARGLASTRADAAERELETRKDAAKQLAKLDEDYQKARVKAAKDFSDSLLDAAGNLDAKQVYELQRNFARQEEEAKTAHDDQRKEIEAGLEERLDQEAKALDKSLRQQQEAYDRQIAEGRENDRLRLEDMKADFAQRKAREDADRAIRISDQAADHAAQLAEMDTQHGLRLNQIRTHAIEERAALAAAADAAEVAAGVADEATRKRVEAKEKHLEDMWDKYHKHIEDSLKLDIPRTLIGGPVRAYATGGYVPQTGLAFLHAGEFVMPARNVTRGMGGRSVSIGDINVSVAGSNAAPNDIARAVRVELIRALEEAA